MLYKLCGYWGDRRESYDDLAERLHGFLITLAACDPVFAEWYERGGAHRQSNPDRIDATNKSVLVDLLKKGRTFTDFGNRVIEELGFHIGMWNGRNASESVGLSITCGSYGAIAGIGSNCVILDLPDNLGPLRHSERMADVLLAVADHWQPDWASAFSHYAMNSRRYDASVPFVDWMVFISYKLMPDVRERVCSRHVNEMGALIIVDDEPAQEDDRGHLMKVQTVQAALGFPDGTRH